MDYVMWGSESFTNCLLTLLFNLSASGISDHSDLVFSNHGDINFTSQRS
jgi:hypothetical protein